MPHPVDIAMYADKNKADKYGGMEISALKE